MNVSVRIRICVGITNINKINQCTKKTTQSCMAASFDGKNAMQTDLLFITQFIPTV